MLRSDLPSHRRSPEPVLVDALGRREPLALAEACSRTLPVAHAVGRRLVGAAHIEGLLLAVYRDLWAAPPTDASLERWVRARTAALGLETLRALGTAPSAPSVRVVAPDLPEPRSSYLDAAERTLAALDAEARLALVSAHDTGVPSSAQGGTRAGRDVARALRALADPDTAPADDDDDDGQIADLVLGLLLPDEAAALEAKIAADPEGSARLQVLRRGRRRIEGLPPTPDLGTRIVAAVLTGLASETATEAEAAAPAAAAAGHAPAEADPEPRPTPEPETPEGTALADEAATGAVEEQEPEPERPWRPASWQRQDMAPAAPPVAAAPPGAPPAGEPTATHEPAATEERSPTEQPREPAEPPVAARDTAPAPAPEREGGASPAPADAGRRAQDRHHPAAPPLPEALRDDGDDPPPRHAAFLEDSTEDLLIPGADEGWEDDGWGPEAGWREGAARSDDDPHEDRPPPPGRHRPAHAFDDVEDYDDAHDYDDYHEAMVHDDDDPRGRSGLPRLVQAVGILLLIGLIIGGGLYVGQMLYRIVF